MTLQRVIVGGVTFVVCGYGIASGCKLAASPGAEPTGGTGGSPPREPQPTMTLPDHLSPTCATALQGPFESSLPAPTGVRVEGDDRSARFSWSGPERGFDRATNNSIEGYRICWGRSEENLDHAVLFTSRVGTIFDVPNDEPLVAVVQAVDWRGRISPPSDLVRFQGDPSRVRKLSAEMTGFFDDFNEAPGPLDERRWNVAFSRCNDPTASHAYVSEGFHAVSVLGNSSQLPGSEPGCDRAQNVMRARSVFDFRGRIGRIAFDFDGTTGNRSTWYVDVFPYASEADLIDITGHVSFDPGRGHPGRFLRFSQADNHLMIHQLSRTGEPLHVLDAWLPAELELLPGQLLRHWELRVGKNYAAIFIDGELVLENKDIDLDFERGIVHFAQFGYNPIKIGYPWHMIHWDNFGFDGPRSSLVTHNYKTSFSRDDSISMVEPSRRAQWRVEIPDSLDGAESARYFYTIQTRGYRWDPGDAFQLNGRKFPLPEPQSPVGTWQEGILGEYYPPYSGSVEIPLDLLRVGSNVFDFSAASTTLLNHHLEVYFTGEEERPYTPPRDDVGRQLPALLPLGPSARWNMINGERCFSDESFWKLEFEGESKLVLRRPVSGEMSVAVAIDNERPVRMFGKNWGIARVELLVDGRIVQSIDTAENVPAPSLAGSSWRWPHEGGFELSFDTTELEDGPHLLEVRAFDSIGSASRANYWERPEWGVNRDAPGFGAPIHFTVSNGGDD